MRLSAVVSLFVTALAFTAGAAAAEEVAQTIPVQAAPTTVQVTAPTPSSGANTLICHQVVYDGMLVRRPQCFTAHQWEARQATRQRELQELQIRAASMH